MDSTTSGKSFAVEVGALVLPLTLLLGSEETGSDDLSTSWSLYLCLWAPELQKLMSSPRDAFPGLFFSLNIFYLGVGVVANLIRRERWWLVCLLGCEIFKGKSLHEEPIPSNLFSWSYLSEENYLLNLWPCCAEAEYCVRMWLLPNLPLLAESMRYQSPDKAGMDKSMLLSCDGPCYNVTNIFKRLENIVLLCWSNTINELLVQ